MLLFSRFNASSTSLSETLAQNPGKNEQQCYYSTLQCSSDVLTIHFYYSSVVIMKFYYSVSVKCVADTLIVFN